MRKIVELILMFIDWFFPEVSKKITMFYWMTSDKVHGDTSWDAYNFYYLKIKEIMNLLKDDSILDGACGTGQITYLFHKDGYRIKGFDFSDYLICKARLNFSEVDFYVDDLIKMKHTDKQFHKIFVNGAIFYIHPKFLQKTIINLYSILNKEGELYILDYPDFSKRRKIVGRIGYLITSLLPVYQPSLGGFWYKKKWIEKAAVNGGFKKVEFFDSWANYRTHAVLKKVVKND